MRSPLASRPDSLRTWAGYAVWTTPNGLTAAAQADALVQDWAVVLMITARGAGTRWGELVGLSGLSGHLDEGGVVIDRNL